MERDRSVGRLLGVLHRCARMRFAEAAIAYEIADTQLPILMGLYHQEGLSQDDLARQHVLDKATVARSVARLERAGYVVRSPDEHDRRIKRVELTEKARRIQSELRQVHQEWSEALTEGFTREERRTLTALLERMVANAQRHLDRSR